MRRFATEWSTNVSPFIAPRSELAYAPLAMSTRTAFAPRARTLRAEGSGAIRAGMRGVVAGLVGLLYGAMGKSERCGCACARQEAVI